MVHKRLIARIKGTGKRGTIPRLEATETMDHGPRDTEIVLSIAAIEYFILGYRNCFTSSYDAMFVRNL